MSQTIPKNISASVRQQLLNLAKKRGEAFDMVLVRYALERLLYRISKSKWHDRFLLKGAMLFPLWYSVQYRSTKDMDLLGYGEGNVPSMLNTFKSICKLNVENDGISYLEENILGSEMREENKYQGVRMQLVATLSGARIPLQVDIAFGDMVIPDPEVALYPTLLDFPPPRILVYSKQSVVAEKFQAMVIFGIANSRMKDFYDLWVLASRTVFDGLTLSQAIKVTFERRKTTLPVKTPTPLTDLFAQDRAKKAQWESFTRKKGLYEKEELSTVIELLRKFLMPPTLAAAKGEPLNLHWRAGGPWKSKK